MIETSLHSYLLAQSSITALIGDRLYPIVIPQEGNDALKQGQSVASYKVTKPRFSHHLQGGAGAATANVLLAAWNLDYVESLTLANEIRLALQGFRGDLSGTEVGSTTLKTEDQNFYIIEATEDGYFVIEHDYSFEYRI